MNYLALFIVALMVGLLFIIFEVANGSVKHFVITAVTLVAGLGVIYLMTV